MIAERQKQLGFVLLERLFILPPVEADEKHQAAFGQFVGDAHQVIEIEAPGEIIDRLARVVETRVAHHLTGTIERGVGELIVGRHRMPFGGKGFRKIDAAMHPALHGHLRTWCRHFAPPGRCEGHQLTECLQAIGDESRRPALPRQPAKVQYAMIECLERDHRCVTVDSISLPHHCVPVHCMAFSFDDAMARDGRPARNDINGYKVLCSPYS
ncbi:hypothetical protein D3C81_1066970 [compost metagenome]